MHVYNYFGNNDYVRSMLENLMRQDYIRKNGPGLYGAPMPMGSDCYEPTQKGLMRLWLSED